MTLTTGTATSFITFSRASAATRINASGAIETVASGVARIDYNPVTLAAKGLLVEEQRTNLLLNSASLSTQSVTVSATPYTLSFYGTGTVTLSGVSTAGPLVGTGAFPSRVVLTFTPTAGTLTVTVSGSVVNAQLEAGSFATSYIPTTSASATRVADVAYVPTSAFPYSSSEGTLGIKFTPMLTALPAIALSLSDASSANRMSVNGFGTATVNNAGAVTAAASSSITTGQLAKTYFALANNDFAASLNGSAVSTDNSVSFPTATTLWIGNLLNGNQMSGHIQNVVYIPRRLTNAELQARSA